MQAVVSRKIRLARTFEKFRVSSVESKFLQDMQLELRGSPSNHFRILVVNSVDIVSSSSAHPFSGSAAAEGRWKEAPPHVVHELTFHFSSAPWIDSDRVRQSLTMHSCIQPWAG